MTITPSATANAMSNTVAIKGDSPFRERETSEKMQLTPFFINSYEAADPFKSFVVILVNLLRSAVNQYAYKHPRD